MKVGKKARKKLKFFLAAFAIFIFILIFLFRFAELKEISILLKESKKTWLLTAFLIQLTSFIFLSLFYKVLLKDISFPYLFKTVFAMFFVDTVFPSFSLSGNAMLYYAARKGKAKRKRASLAVGINLFMNLLVYFLFFVFGFACLWLKGTKIYFPYVLLLFLLLFFIFWLLFTEKGKYLSLKFLKFSLRRWPKVKKKALSFVGDFFHARKKEKKKVFFYAFSLLFFSYLLRILAIFFSFLCFSYVISFSKLILGYAIAAFLSAVSYIKIGIYEASMTIAFTKLGVPYNLALTTTLVYRAISFWIPLIVGFVCFRNLIKSRK